MTSVQSPLLIITCLYFVYNESNANAGACCSLYSVVLRLVAFPRSIPFNRHTGKKDRMYYDCIHSKNHLFLQHSLPLERNLAVYSRLCWLLSSPITYSFSTELFQNYAKLVTSKPFLFEFAM